MSREVDWKSGCTHIRLSLGESQEERIAKWLKARSDCGFTTKIVQQKFYSDNGDTIIRIEYLYNN